MFSSYDIRGRLGESLTNEYVWNVGKALADWLPLEGRIAVVSESDASEIVVKALVEGLRLQGRDVIDGGRGDMQTLVQISVASHTAGGVLISHDDLQNVEVIALFQENAVAVTLDNGLSDIAALVDAGNFVPAAVKGDLTSIL